MTDDELHTQAALYAVTALDADETSAFEAHLSRCADCRAEVAELREVAASLADSVATDPPASLRSGVLAQIAATAQEPAAAPARGRHARPAADEAPGQPETAPAGAVVPLRPTWRQRLPLLVAAAAVLAAFGFGGWALHQRNDARDDLTASQQVNTELTAILNAGDAQSVSATSSDGASTTVLRSQREGSALLLASGLPSLPAGKTYQAWTFGAEGAPAVSAGTFESQGDQTAYKLPDAAVDAKTVAVSIEDAGGAEQPSKQVVVALTLS